MACDGDFDAGGEGVLFDGFDTFQDVACDRDGVGAFPFGNGDGDGGVELPVGGGVLNDLGGFGGFVGNGGDLFEVNVIGDDEALGVGGGAEEAAGFELDFAAVFGGLAGGEELIGLAQRALYLKRAEVAGGEFGGVERDTEFPAATAEEFHFRHIRGLGDGVLELGGDAAEGGVVVLAGV